MENIRKYSILHKLLFDHQKKECNTTQHSVLFIAVMVGGMVFSQVSDTCMPTGRILNRVGNPRSYALLRFHTFMTV